MLIDLPSGLTVASSWLQGCQLFIMTALWNRAGHYIFIVVSSSSSIFFFLA